MSADIDMDARIDAVWAHAGPNPTWRYVPKAYPGPRMGGWGVWDRKEREFVDHRLASIPLDELTNEQFAN